MNVLLLNGSPHEKGCTFTALEAVANGLNDEGVDAEIMWIDACLTRGCTGCGYCRTNGRCVVNDVVNWAAEEMEHCQGLVVGSPVHYAGASGQLTCVLDRLFCSAGAKLRYKPGAAVVSARRAGTTAALEQLNKYFAINQMPLVSSRYWPMVHGSRPEEVLQDEEGLAIMRTLGKNMAWLIKSIEAGRAAGIALPAPEPPARTNFIR